MVKYSMALEIEYPNTLAMNYNDVHKMVEEVLKNNMGLLQQAADGHDMIPTSIRATWMSGWMQAYKDEAQYQFEEWGMYDEDDPEYNIELTEDDYEEIADSICNDDWLNEQIGEVVRDHVSRHIQEKMEDSDNNE